MKRNEMATVILAGILANQWTVIPSDEKDSEQTDRIKEAVRVAVIATNLLTAELAS